MQKKKERNKTKMKTTKSGERNNLEERTDCFQTMTTKNS